MQLIKRQSHYKVIKLLLAIPRSNSTLIESVLARSQSISGAIHEPFHKYGYYKKSVNTAYSCIDKKICSSERDAPKHFIAKDMTQWVSRLSGHEKILPLVDQPIILCIRNPLLAIESKILKILQTANRIDRPGLLKRIIEHDMINDPHLVQNSVDGLDLVAKKHGYKSWDLFVNIEAETNRDIELFAIIIDYFVDRGDDIWGWRSLESIVSFMDKKDILYKILDGTDFRLKPELTTRILCENLNIAFSKDMLYQATPNKKMGIRESQSEGMLWYDTVLESNNVILPDKKPLYISDFPSKVQVYINRYALPLYKSLYSNTNKISIHISERDKNVVNYSKIDLLYKELNKI